MRANKIVDAEKLLREINDNENDSIIDGAKLRVRSHEILAHILRKSHRDNEAVLVELQLLKEIRNFNRLLATRRDNELVQDATGI